ncbi:unnamed protein product, partial [Musa hybrid cultivar]
SFEGPGTLAPNHLLFLFGEVGDDAEVVPDFLHGHLLDGVGHGLAGEVEQPRHVEERGCVGDVQQHVLVELHQLLVELLQRLHAPRAAAAARVPLAVLHHLAEHRAGDATREGDHLRVVAAATDFREQVLECPGSVGGGHVHGKLLAVVGLENHLLLATIGLLCSLRHDRSRFLET